MIQIEAKQTYKAKIQITPQIWGIFINLSILISDLNIGLRLELLEKRMFFPTC